MSEDEFRGKPSVDPILFVAFIFIIAYGLYLIYKA